MTTEKSWRDIFYVSATTLVAFGILASSDGAEFLFGILSDTEFIELDELVLAAFVLIPGALWFAARRWSEARRELAARWEIEQKLVSTLESLESQVHERTAAHAASEKRAKDAQAQLLHVIETMGDGLALFDQDDRLILCNEQYTRIFEDIADVIHTGVSFEELVRVAADRQTHLDCRHNAQDWINRRLAAHRNGDSSFTQRLRNGKWIITKTTRTTNGYTLSTHVDVTELKHNEENLRNREQQIRLITDAAPILIAHIGADLRYRFINRTGASWYARPREEIIGHALVELFSSSEMAHLQHLIDRALIGETVNEELELTYPDGQQRSVRLTLVPHILENGVVEGYFALADDITERRQAEMRLHQAQKMEALGQLTGGLAHDFNNILGVILGNLEILKSRLKNEALLHAVTETAIKAAMRGGDLTERLLSFSRSQSLDPQSTDLHEIVKETVEFARSSMGSQVDISVNLPDHLWPVMVDPVQLQSALLNLAINARDAMPGGGTLTFEAANIHASSLKDATASALESGDYVRLSVIDTGEGMPETVRQHAFDPFYTTKDVGHGSGLGLSMVHGFVNQSGGHIVIDSEIGRGTTMALFLPRASAAVSTPIDGAKCAAAYVGHGETILVVMAENAESRITINQLRDLGYVVLNTGNGRSASGVIHKSTHVDLLIVDAVLPDGESGYDFARMACLAHPSMKVIMTASKADVSGLEDNLEDEGIALLHKPYHKPDLARMTRAVLARPTNTLPLAMTRTAT